MLSGVRSALAENVIVATATKEIGEKLSPATDTETASEVAKETAVQQAVSSKSDLIPYVYEGGMKVLKLRLRTLAHKPSSRSHTLLLPFKRYGNALAI